MPTRKIKPETWYDIKERWVRGDFACALDLHRWAKKRYPGGTCPTLNTIQQRMSKEGDWVRGRATIEEQQRIEAYSQKLFEEKNLSHSRVIDSIVEGVEGATALIQQYIKEAKDSSGVMTSAILEKIEDARRLKIAWIKEYKEFTGNIAPTKRIIEIDLEAKWGVAQDEACNQAYLKRLGRHPSQTVATDAEVIQPKRVEVKNGKRE